IAHKPQHARGQRRTKEQGQDQGLQAVLNEESGAHAVEAKACLKPEFSPRRKRQSDDAHDGKHGTKQQQLPQHFIVDEHPQLMIEELKPTQQSEAHQHSGFSDAFHHAELHLRDGVVRGALVAMQADPSGEGGGDARAVRLHMAALTGCEPQADSDVGEQEGDKQQGEHGGSVYAKIGVLRMDYMAANDQRLVWLDMEMTGLDPEKERIIEVAVVVTEPDLSFVAEGPVLV